MTVHVAIFTIHLDGLRELYRQFLRLPDGAILEIFGDISSAKLLPDVKASIMRRQADLEDLEEEAPESQTPPANQSRAQSRPQSRAQSGRLNQAQGCRFFG